MTDSTEQKEHTFTCPACKNEVKEIRGSVNNGHLCIECSEAYEKSVQKGSFEGVKAILGGCAFNDHIVSIKLRKANDKLVANIDLHKDLAKEIALRWNCYEDTEALKADVATLQETNSQLATENERLNSHIREGRLGTETQHSMMQSATGATEIQRLYEEKTRFTQDELKKSWRRLAESLQDQLREAKERIEFLEADAKNQASLRGAEMAWCEENYKKLQERIKELETPKLYRRDEWCEEYRDVIWLSTADLAPVIGSPLDTDWDEIEMETYLFFQKMPSLTTKYFNEVYAEWKAAQAALKEGGG